MPNTPPIIAGFVEGLLAPVSELIAAVLLTAGFQISQTTGGSSSFLALGAAIFLAIDFIRNIALGLSHSQFAIGSVAGNIFGIWIFYTAVASISQDAATESLLLTLALVISFIVGLVLLAHSYISNSS